MRDFEENLERQLRAAAPAAARLAQSTIRRRRLGSASAVVGVGVALVAVVGIPSAAQTPSAYADIPAFDRPATFAPDRVMSGDLAAKVRQDAARKVDTHFGAGYVMPSIDGKVVCLSIPDPVEGYGVTCAKSDEVRARGLAGTLSSPQGSKEPSELVLVLPEGASAPIAELSGGESKRLDVVDGVAVGVFDTDATVKVTSGDGASHSYQVFGREPEGNEYRDCGNERYVLVPKDFKGDSTPLCKRP